MKIILFVLLSARVVYASSIIDRCQRYLIRHFSSQPKLSFDLNESQKEKRFMDIAFMITNLDSKPVSLFAERKRFNAYQVIKNILDNHPSSSLKLRIALLAAEDYWGNFGPLILMELLEPTPEPDVQIQIASSIVNMHFAHRNYLSKIREISKAISMNFNSSNYFESSPDSELLKARMSVLKKLIEKKPPPQVQKKIAHSLGQIQHPIGGSLLELMLQTPVAPNVLEEIILSAGLIDSARGVPALIMIVRDNPSNPPLQSTIISSIDNIGIDGIPVLEAILENNPPYELMLELAYYAGLLSESTGTLTLSKILNHKTLSNEERSAIVSAYFTGKSNKQKNIHHSADNERNPNKDSDDSDFPFFIPSVF